MQAVKAIVLFSMIIFSSATTTQAVLDYATYTSNCVGTSWNSNNMNCFNNKLAGYQCCATTTSITILGATSSTTLCTVKDLSSTSTTTGSGGIGGLASASVTQVCAGSSVSMIFGAIAMFFMMIFS